MAHSLSSVLSTPRFSVHPRNARRALSGPFVVGISRSASSIHAQRAIAVQAAMEPPAPPASDGTSAAAPSKEDAKKKGASMNLLLPDVPSWASWILGAAVLFAFPFYRRILKIEDKVEKAVEIVGEVAAEAEKFSQGLAESLPENSQLKQVALKAEMIAEEVAEDAEKVEAIMKKADAVVENVETVVKNIIEGCEEGIQEGNGSNKQRTDLN